jgi:hypothetical protein
MTSTSATVATTAAAGRPNRRESAVPTQTATNSDRRSMQSGITTRWKWIVSGIPPNRAPDWNPNCIHRSLAPASQAMSPSGPRSTWVSTH